MANDVNHILMCLFLLCILLLLKYFFMSFVHFMWIFIFYYWVLRVYYIFEVLVWVRYVICHSFLPFQADLFFLLIRYFTEQNFPILIRYILSIFLFMGHAFCTKSKNSLLSPKSQRYFSFLLLKSFHSFVLYIYV